MSGTWRLADSPRTSQQVRVEPQMATLQVFDGASLSLLLTISVTDISWLHEQIETATAADTRRVPHPARLVRQGAPRLRHHAAGQGGFGRCGENGAGNPVRLA